MAAKQRLGEVLVQQGIVSEADVDAALRVQVGGNRRLGHILLRMGVVTDDQMVDVLAKQLNTPVINVSKTFHSDVKKVMPRYLCNKYGIIPLAYKDNNILELAMADPSDHEAISDIEHYTGRVAEPRLARQSEISHEIKRLIPYSAKDLFNPQSSTMLTRLASMSALALVIVLGIFTYQYIQTSQHGTVSQIDDATIYKNHDLMLGFSQTGKISLLGHGAFSKGYYSVSFNNTNTLRAFIASRNNDFSAKQKEWLGWVIEKSGDKDNMSSSVATAK